MGRKRANTVQTKNNKATPKEKGQIPPLAQAETGYFQQLVESSNQYAGLLKQKASFEFILKQLTSSRTKVQKGEVELPVSIVLIPKVLSYMEGDKKKVLALFDKHIKQYQQNMKALTSQLEFAYENFTESGIRNKEYFVQRFKTAEVTSIADIERKVLPDEETLFEGEYNKLVEESDEGKKLRNDLKKANREAVKRNTKQKKN